MTVVKEKQVKQYKAYNITVQGDHAWGTYELNIGADLRAKYGTYYDIPAKTLMIVANDDYQLKLNALTEDIIVISVADAGKVLTFMKEDIEIFKVYFASLIPSGSAADVTLTVIATG